jgi:Haem-binding uptake, Tiki superfamily, ChaN
MIRGFHISTASMRGRFFLPSLAGRLLFSLAAMGLLPTSNAAELKPAVSMDPIEGILREFETHDVVALSEGRHNNEQAHAFRLRLIRDPKFTDVVNDVVVESGNARYQPLIDRYLQGEQVPRDELLRVWQDTTVANEVWDVPIYEEFFLAVRELNTTRPFNRRLRVLLGDPPIDWDQVKSRTEWMQWLGQRDSYPASLGDEFVPAIERVSKSRS